MGSVTDSWKSSHGKWKTKRVCQIKFSRITLQPKLELLCGPPTHCGSSPRDPQSFRLLPLAVSAGGDPLSPDGRGTCLWNAEVALQGHDLLLCIDICRSALLWECSTAKCEICGSVFCHCVDSRNHLQGAVAKTLLKWFRFAWVLEHFASWWKARFFYENVPETSLKTYLSSVWYVRKIYQPLKECPFLGGKRGPPKQLILFEGRWRSQEGYASRYRTHPKNKFYRGPPQAITTSAQFIPQ